MRAGQDLVYTAALTTSADGLAALTWTLVDGAEATVTSGSVIPEAGAISVDITVLATHNTLLPGAMLGDRELSWQFEGDYDLHRYRLEASIPFGVSPEGVRQKLGLSAADLSDAEIPLLKAYLTFQSRVGSTLLAAVTDDLTILTVTDAIEAGAALAVLPTLQVRVAEKESSGTNQFARGSIDWAALAGVLAALVSEGEGLVNPALEVASSGVSLLQLVTPDVDLFPGA